MGTNQNHFMINLSCMVIDKAVEVINDMRGESVTVS